MSLLIIKVEPTPLSYRPSFSVRHYLLASFSLKSLPQPYSNSRSITTSNTSHPNKLRTRPVFVKSLHTLHNVPNNQRYNYPPKLHPSLHKIRHWRRRKHSQEHLHAHRTLCTSHNSDSLERTILHRHRRSRKFSFLRRASQHLLRRVTRPGQHS